MGKHSTEPLVIRGAIVAAVTAIIHFLVIANLIGFTPEQETAMAGVVDLVGTAVLVIWTRGAVTPVVKVAAEEEMHTGDVLAGQAAEKHGLDEGTPVEVVPDGTIEGMQGRFNGACS